MRWNDGSGLTTLARTDSRVALPRIEAISESAILLRFGDRIAVSCNNQVHAAARSLRSSALPGLIELVPAYATLAVHYNPAVWCSDDKLTPSQAFTTAVLKCLESKRGDLDGDVFRVVTIPVCYDAEFGVDLTQASSTLRLDVDQIIKRHTSADYRVAMLGFAPGFPYLLGLDPALQLPRREQPRLRVPAGSVAIGGAQTGIYPSELPGGWNLIGRTPLRLFDVERLPPQSLNPGDRVRFESISRHRYDELLQTQA